MTGTVRIERFESSPATTFYLSADELPVTQAHRDGNYTVVRTYVRAMNGPGASTGSQYNGYGYQAVWFNEGYGEPGRHEGNPFLPAGYANGATRWEAGPFDTAIAHNDAGDKAITIRMLLSYGAISRDIGFTLGLTFLPKPPKAPAAPTVTPATNGRSATIGFVAPANGGSPITGYKIQRATNAAFTTGVATVSAAGSPSLVASLDPGIEYWWRVAAVNANGTGPYSPATRALQPNRALGRIRNAADTGWLDLAGRLRSADNLAWVNAEGRIRSADDMSWLSLGS